MQDILKIIGRKDYSLINDINAHEKTLKNRIENSTFLVLGGAGTIGQAVTKEIFKRNPKKLYVVDVSENNLTELVRDIRSSFGYIEGDFRTFALDIGSAEYDSFIRHDGKFDYVLNLSALKHVRSEENSFTLMRMIEVNVFNTKKTIRQSISNGSKKYFCVSTDKAANPVNMMGATKRIMEMYLMQSSPEINISMARFANVAFSDGSLLHSFNQRISKRQPIVVPSDIKRYFITQEESGELCLMSCILGENRDIFFPKLDDLIHLQSLYKIALRFINYMGYIPYLCDSEEQARELILTLPDQGKWPCLITKSDTTGEKESEEFYTDKETIDFNRFESLGIIKNNPTSIQKHLERFENEIRKIKLTNVWDKKSIVSEFFKLIPDFKYRDLGKYLDGKM